MCFDISLDNLLTMYDLALSPLDSDFNIMLDDLNDCTIVKYHNEYFFYSEINQ